MTVATLRPNADVSVGAGWSIGGGSGSHAAAQSDNSDSTYSTFTTGAVTTLTLGFGTVTIPALAQIRSVTLRIRWSHPDAGGGIFWENNIYSQVGSDTRFELVIATIGSASTAISTTSGPARATNPAGGTWTQADLDALQIVENQPAAGGDGPGAPRFYEAYYDVVYNEAPVAVVTGPGAAPFVSTPAVTWTYSDPDFNSQERYWVKVFDAATYGGGGFDPETSTAAWDSGEVISPAVTATTGVLDNGTTYKAYVKVADSGSGGRYSAWAVGSAFTITVDPPAVPTITATADSANARVSIVLQGRDNVLTANQADFETSTAGWAAVSNCSISRSTLQAAHGSASLLMTAAAAGLMVARTPAGLSGIAVRPGIAYKIMGAPRTATAVTRNCGVAVLWYDAAGGSLSSTTASNNAITNTFHLMTATATAPANAAFAAMELDVFNAGGAAEGVHFDTVSLAPGASLTWTPGGYVATQTVEVQRSDDGGVTWTTVRGLSALDLTDPGQYSATLYDYEAPIGTAVLYRARTTASPSGSALVSAWSTSASATLTANCRAWLKDPADPTRNMRLDLAFPLASSSTEPLTVDKPIGRSTFVVSGDVPSGEVYSLDVTLSTDDDLAAFEALRTSGRSLLLQTEFGDGTGTFEQNYVRLGSTRQVTRILADGGYAFRRVTVDAYTVAAPP